MRTTLNILLLVLVTLLGPAAPALASTPTDVIVEDRAGVLDQNTLLPAVGNIEFRNPTKVAIYTYRGSADENLNEEVLRFARAEHPEWLSTDGQKWADGLYLFALDPEGRHVGTYMGEDRKVSPDQRADIQESTKDLFRDAQWTEGTIEGVEKAAALINRPWYQSGGFIVAVVLAVVAAVIFAGIFLVHRRRNRDRARLKRENGDRSFASVSLDLDATELNARTIPASSSYGGMVLEKYRSFRADYSSASKLNQQVHGMSARDFSRGRNVQVVQNYAEAAGKLDALDDVIADSNTFLNQYSGWPSAWDRQTAPLRRDLDGLDALLDDDDDASAATAAALRSFRENSLQTLEQWSADLAAGRRAPDDALDGLRAAREQFTALLKQHAEMVIDIHARTSEESELMRKDLVENASASGAPPASILDTVYPAYSFYSVASFSAGITAGQSSIDAARSASTTGYGSSGGSFSGAGSSSSF